MGITKFVLKRPVTAILCILCLIVFGIQSIRSATVELMSDMDMPMMMIMAQYSGASSEDVNKLVTEPIEDAVGTLTNVKSVSSTSSEGSSRVMLEYEYGTDMDDAYDNLKKKMDNITRNLPDDVDTPSIMEMSSSEQPCVTLSIQNDSQANLANYVEDTIIPEFEKISSIAEVSSRGGQSEYIRIELNKEMMQQYNTDMSSIASAISSADLAYPAGSTEVGSLSFSVTTSTSFDTVEALKDIPITTSKGSIIYLEDVASISTALNDASSIARYDGQDTISVSIVKQQSSTAMEVSSAVKSTIETLTAADPDLQIVVASDTSDSIKDSLMSVVQTLIMAVITSMIIIFLFFGDLKASMIVGSSIPISIMSALILMNLMGFSLNVITMSALVLGVGMMVDNSIVVLESCFRAAEKEGGIGLLEFARAALEGTGIVTQSIIGSTVTTCVVFLPLAFLQGMTGQMFKPLGFTIVFCMVASLISAMTVVPLCYSIYRPKEKKAVVSGLIKRMQDGYRKMMRVILPKKKTVMLISVLMLVAAFKMAGTLRMELMPSDDQGTVSISVDTRPGLVLEKSDAILKQIEALIADDENLESYMLSFNGNSGTITATLKDDRKLSTDEVVEKWKPSLTSIPDCTVSVSASASMSMMSSSTASYSTIIKGTQYDELKAASSAIVDELNAHEGVMNVHSTLENSAPVVNIKVDSVMAKAEGLTPSAIGLAVHNMLSGVEATTLAVDGNDISVMVEYPKDEFKSIDQLQGITIPTTNGGSVALTDVASIVFKDSPASIRRSSKEYQVTITADYKADVTDTYALESELNQSVVAQHLSSTVTAGRSSMQQRQQEEFSSLYTAIATAVFLIFVVMAMQFESPKFSIMVMTTIPFSLIGSFGLLYITGVTISMTSLLGFLMLIGTVVNNGILYVDTVNQYRATMDLTTALVEAGATRMRPILMTTLTTLISMVPMAMAFGNSGSTTQGLAIVNLGGLVASTILALLMLPVYYSIMNGKKELRTLDID